MGIFDFFKKNKAAPEKQSNPSKHTLISDAEKKHYQPDSYYTDVAFAGTAFEKRVVTFDERKKTAIPSATGLYPAEILLLEYCSYGSYPGPKNGYPGFWWFEYGIRNVGAALKSLEERGYIFLGSAKESINSLTVTQLKEFLLDKELSTSGKKAELVERVAAVASEEELVAFGVQAKYSLTTLGQQELSENEYVPYMHKAHNKTTEDDRWGTAFNVWSINKLLGTGDKANWRTVVDQLETKRQKETEDNNKATMAQLKKSNPALFKELDAQDRQLNAIKAARAIYEDNKDLETYIIFWEDLWANGGLTFPGSHWHFELPDLYISAERYDDALAFVKKLKKQKAEYAGKADNYVKKIESLKEKKTKKNSKK